MEVQVAGVVVTTIDDVDVEEQLSQRASAGFVVLDPEGDNHYTQGTPVLVYNDDGDRIFGGVVMTDDESKPTFEPLLTHRIAAGDNAYHVDKRRVAKGYLNTACGDIVSDLIEQYLSREGIIGSRKAPVFTRASTAYKLDGTSVTSGTVRYETGAFGQAAWVEEGTTNLLTANQSSVETDTTGFVAIGATLTRDTVEFFHGVASLKVVTNGGSSFEGEKIVLVPATFTAGQKYSISARVKAPNGVAMRIVLQLSVSPFTNYAVTNFTGTGAWQRITATGTMPDPIGSDNFEFLVVRTTTATVDTFYCDTLQLEQKSYASSWQLAGSARNNEVLALPPAATLVNPQEGSIDVRFHANAVSRRQVASAFPRLFNLAVAPPADDFRGILAYHANASADWVFEIWDEDGTMLSSCTAPDSHTPDGFHLLTFTWSLHDQIIEIYVDGTLRGSAALTTAPSQMRTTGGAWIGSYSTNNYSSTYFDEFRTSSRRRKAAEISAYWNAALTNDDATCYLLNFNTALTTEGSIQAGPIVEELTANYVSAAAVMDALAERSSFWWNVDEYRLFHFKAPGTHSAPFTVDGTIMEESSVRVRRANPQYRNRQYILGGTDITSLQTQSFKGDGTNRSFALGYPVAKTPTSVKVNSVTKTVGIKSVDTGKDWYWSKGDPVIYQDTGGAVLISTDTLEVQYNGLFNVIILSEDTAEVVTQQALEGVSSGMVEDVHEDASVTSQSIGFQVANAKLNKFSQQGILLSFATRQIGLRPGQIATVNLAEHGVTGTQFLIERIQWFIGPDLKFWCAVAAVSGPANNNWVSWWQKILRKRDALIDKISLGSGSTITVLVSVDDTWSWVENVTNTPQTCDFPDTIIYPETNRFPC